MQQIQRIIETAKKISTSDLNKRIMLKGPQDELYTMAETLNGMLDRLEQGFESQKAFIASASHDLRTPLTVIKSYTDLLRRWGKNDVTVIEESVESIAKSVGSMERLVNDLLFLAKLQLTKSLETVPLSICDIVQEMAHDTRVLFENISIEVNCPGEVIVKADEYYLRRALWALIDNAVKYSRPSKRIILNVRPNAYKGEVLRLVLMCICVVLGFSIARFTKLDMKREDINILLC